MPSNSSAASSARSAASVPSSVRMIDFCFSSTSYISASNVFTTASTFRYSSDLSSVGPEMISGVRASSISTLSTSSMMA